MGRGRQKAKQTKVARELKYHTSSIDVNALQRELTGGAVYQPPPPPVVDDDDDDDDPIAVYSKYAEQLSDDDPAIYVAPSRRR
jgi:hypothetical protein